MDKSVLDQQGRYDPRKWESVKRYDGPGSDPHYNKVLEQYVETPHVHEPCSPGGVRPALPGEIPK